MGPHCEYIGASREFLPCSGTSVSIQAHAWGVFNEWAVVYHQGMTESTEFYMTKLLRLVLSRGSAVLQQLDYLRALLMFRDIQGCLAVCICSV